MAVEVNVAKERILNIIADVALDDDVNDIEPAKSLKDQLDLDSMDFLDIVMELKKQYHVEVPQADYKELETLDSCVNYLAPKFN